MDTTIVAIASPPGPAPRGILRLSGPRARELANAVLEAQPVLLAPSAPRGAFTARLHDGVGTQPVRVLWMPGPASYTREDVVELHLVGAPPLLARALERLLALGAEPARPGEFTRRAFLNGRIDLTRAEGVLALVEASNERERRAATGLLTGGLGRRVDEIRAPLDDLRALCEASLDFDEADTGHVPEAELLARLDALGEELDRTLAWEVARQAPSALPRVSLFGEPNAGKSSLFNRLVPEGCALVSEVPGTTRDAPAGLAPLLGTEVHLVDAPGLDPSARGPDADAQRRARAELEQTDAVLWVVDAAAERARLAEAVRRGAAALPRGTPRVLVANQVDRLPGGRFAATPEEREAWGASTPVVPTSAREGHGLDALREALARVLGLVADAGERGESPEPRAPGLGRELFARHRRALAGARAAVAEARSQLTEGHPLDLVAETLRGAGREVDAIRGETTAEDLLDRIFARFCLGK